jgi:hypothetical protein
MGAKISAVEYFHTTVVDRPGEAYAMLSRLASSGVNLLAFNAVPAGEDRTQLVLFPESVPELAAAAERAGLVLDGPHRALLIRGDDRLGAFAEIHRTLADAGVNVYASSGVTADCGRFGYVVYVRAEDVDQAARLLGAG